MKRQHRGVRVQILRIGTTVGFVLAAGACAEPPPGATETIDPDAIRPFTVDVPGEVLADLNDRLERTRLPDQIPGTGWAYGTDGAYLAELLEYWRDDFDWRAHERELNAFDHFKTVIDGVDLHFIHQRSPNPDATPLLLIHGWPGSVFEFTGIIDRLTEPESGGGDARDAFHLVIPSLPGFGFSDAPAETGWGPERMADAFATLMDRLGYETYGVQGGDWGGIIGRSLAGNYPGNVMGFHTNFVLGGPSPGIDPDAGVTDEERALRAERVEAFAEGSAYQEIQGTKPQSLGVGLNDSPAGLAAWIVEKFHGWSDNGGHVEDAFTKDQLLANIPDLLRVPPRPDPAPRVVRVRPDGGRRLPERDLLHSARVGGVAIQHRSLDRDAERRSLRRARGARPSRGRRACLLRRTSREEIEAPGCDPAAGTAPLHRPGDVGTRNPSPCEGLLIIRARSPGVL
ncbi:MAG: epoxide hydrolase family protein [Longimicrobiales bacterium]